jgi:hypothetical protein
LVSLNELAVYFASLLRFREGCRNQLIPLLNNPSQASSCYNIDKSDGFLRILL